MYKLAKSVYYANYGNVFYSENGDCAIGSRSRYEDDYEYNLGTVGYFHRGLAGLGFSDAVEEIEHRLDKSYRKQKALYDGDDDCDDLTQDIWRSAYSKLFGSDDGVYRDDDDDQFDWGFQKRRHP